MDRNNGEIERANTQSTAENPMHTEPEKHNCKLVCEMEEKIINTIQLKVKTIEEKAACNANVYQKIYCRDLSGTEITVMNWNMERRLPLDLSEYPFVAEMDIYPESSDDGTAYYKLCKCTVLPEENLDLFEPENHVDPNKSVKYIKCILSKLPPFLKRFVALTLNEVIDKFAVYPLTSNKAFSRRCGIIEATCRLVVLAEKTAPIFHLDVDLMRAAAMLYYVGYTDTMNRGYALTKEALLGENAGSDQLSRTYYKMSGDEEDSKLIDQEMYLVLRNIISYQRVCPYTAETEYINTDRCMLYTKEAAVMRCLHEMLMETDYLDENMKATPAGTIANLPIGGKVYKTPVFLPVKDSENEEKDEKKTT